MKIDDLTVGVDFKRCSECEYKTNSSLRDDLLVTAGARAAYMDGVCICLPSGIEGEGELAVFISRAVDYYILNNLEKNFDEYIETALKEKYGYTKGE